MRYLAIDYGNKYTGIAICDQTEKIASPVTVIKGSKGLLKKIAELVESENAGAIVLGLPLNMDDSEGFQAHLVRKFAEQLKNCVNVPLHFHDERLSTFSAEEKLAAAEFTTKKRKKRLDAIAAAEILQSFLDQKKTPSSGISHLN
jgi:putative Holliday junction resolvase